MIFCSFLFFRDIDISSCCYTLTHIAGRTATVVSLTRAPLGKTFPVNSTMAALSSLKPDVRSHHQQ